MSAPDTPPQPSAPQSYTVGCVRFTPITETCVRVQQAPPGSAFVDAPHCCRRVAPEHAGAWRAERCDTEVKLTSPRVGVAYRPKAAAAAAERLRLSGLLVNFVPSRSAAGGPPAPPQRVFPQRTRPAAHGLQYHCRLALPGAPVLRDGRVAGVTHPLATGLGLTIVDDTCPDTPDALDLYLLVHGTECAWLYRDLALLLGAPRAPPRWLFGALWDLPAPADADPVAAALARTCGVPLAAALLLRAAPADAAAQRPHCRVCVTLQRPQSPATTATAAVTRLTRETVAAAAASAAASATAAATEVLVTPETPGFDGVRRAHSAGGLGRSLRASRAATPRAEHGVALDLADPRGAAAFAQCVVAPLAPVGFVLPWRPRPAATVARLLAALPEAAAATTEGGKEGGEGTEGTEGGATPCRRPVVFGPPRPVADDSPIDVALGGAVEARWETLRTLPSLVASAAHARCPLWSVPVCGQTGERNDAELYLRWLQLAALCPVLRFSLGAPGERDLCERRPWMLGGAVLGPARQILQFRQSLVPFWHALAAAAARHPGLPIVRSMFVEWPARQEAYHCPAQLMVGPGLLAAPFLAPADPALGLAHTAVWFPPGHTWHEVFGTAVHRGDTWAALYGTLSDVPLYAADGTIVPMFSRDVFAHGPDMLARTLDDTENLPMDILVFPPRSGASSFELFGGAEPCCTARVVCERAPGQAVTVTVSHTADMAAERQYTLCIRGVVLPRGVSIALSCGTTKAAEIPSQYSPDTATLTVGPVLLPAGVSSFVLKFEQEASLDLDALGAERVRQTLHKIFVNCTGSSAVRSKCEQELLAILDKSRGREPADLGAFVASALKTPLFQSLAPEIQRALFKVACDVGFFVFDTLSGERHIVAWNQSGVTGVQLEVYPELASALERFYGSKTVRPRLDLLHSSRSSIVASVSELDYPSLQSSGNLTRSGTLNSTTATIPLVGVTSRVFQVYSRDREGAVRMVLTPPLQEEAKPIMSPQAEQRELSQRYPLRSSLSASRHLAKSLAPLNKSNHHGSVLSQSEIPDGTGKLVPPITKTIVSTTESEPSRSPFFAFLRRYYLAPSKL